MHIYAPNPSKGKGGGKGGKGVKTPAPASPRPSPPLLPLQPPHPLRPRPPLRPPLRRPPRLSRSPRSSSKTSLHSHITLRPRTRTAARRLRTSPPDLTSLQLVLSAPRPVWRCLLACRNFQPLRLAALLVPALLLALPLECPCLTLRPRSRPARLSQRSRKSPQRSLGPRRRPRCRQRLAPRSLVSPRYFSPLYLHFIGSLTLVALNT